MNVSVKFILIQTQPMVFKSGTLQPKSSKMKQSSIFVCPHCEKHRMQIASVLTNQIFFYFNLKSGLYAPSQLSLSN